MNYYYLIFFFRILFYSWMPSFTACRFLLEIERLLTTPIIDNEPSVFLLPNVLSDADQLC